MVRNNDLIYKTFYSLHSSFICTAFLFISFKLAYMKCLKPDPDSNKTNGELNLYIVSFK